MNIEIWINPSLPKIKCQWVFRTILNPFPIRPVFVNSFNPPIIQTPIRICYGTTNREPLSNEVHIRNQFCFNKAKIPDPSKIKIGKNDWVEFWPDNEPVWKKFESSGWLLSTDIISASFIMLSRLEEYNAPSKCFDSLGRFIGTKSLAGKANFLEIPVVDVWANALAKKIGEITNIPVKPWNWNSKGGFAFCLTHDIDRIKLFKNPLKFYSSAGESLKYGYPQQAIKIPFKWLSTILKLSKDPYDTFDFMLSIEHKLKIKATYYFMAGGNSKFDNRYNIKDVMNYLHKIINEGHEVGIHGSYNSYNNAEFLRDEITVLNKCIKYPIKSIRQHYLRWATPKTWQIQHLSGLNVDTTLSFYDRTGFRTGTCRPFQPWNLEYSSVIPIWEIPLIVMDGTLISRMKLLGDSLINKIVNICNIVKSYNGIFVLLWHNSSLHLGGNPSFKKAYIVLLERLIALDPVNLTISGAYNQYIEYLNNKDNY